MDGFRKSHTSIGEEARRLWPQGRSIGQSVDMPPKKTSGLTASKKRPHEAPVKGRKSFAGSRQKVAKGGGGGGDRDDDAGGDDMLEDALDEDEFGRKKGKKGGDSDEDSDEEVKETADEKRLRLAKSYLEKLRREEAEDGSGSDEDEDEDNIRNMDSHDRLANRLKNEAMAKSGRVRREIAHRVVAPTLDDDSDVDEDDETETEGDAWRDIRRGHKLSVTGMSLTPDDSTCYTVSKDGSIARWDIETGARTRFPRGPPAVVDPTRGGGGPMAPPKCGAATLLCCAVSQDHNMLCVAGTDKRIHVWDTRTMKKVHEFASHRGAVTGLAIRDGTGQMFSSSTDKTLKVWSLDDMAYVDTLFGHQSDVLGVAPQRKERVVTVGRDRTCRFWKVAEDSQLIFRPSPGGGQLESVAFTSADTWITGADDGTVALWSTTKKRSVMEWKNVHGFGEEMTGPKFATEDEVDAAVESRLDAQAACGMPETPDPPSNIGLCGRWVNAVAVSKGGDLCASGAGDGAIRVWKISDEPGRQLMPLFTLPARGFVNSLAVASSGRFVLAGMGQEPRQGRWGRDTQARNGLLMHRLTLED